MGTPLLRGVVDSVSSLIEKRSMQLGCILLFYYDPIR